MQGVVSVNGVYYVFGGSYLNDVWSSRDLKSWQQLANADWSARADFGFTTINQRIVVIGGFALSGFALNDVWVPALFLYCICEQLLLL